MRAVLAVLCVLVGARQGLGQFEVLSIERTVETAHPSYGTMRAGAGVTPRSIQAGDPFTPTMPYASQHFDFDARTIGVNNNLWPRRPATGVVGSANATFTATFMLTEPLTTQIFCNHGGGVVEFSGPTGAFPCAQFSTFYPHVVLAPGEYRLDLSHSTESSSTLGGNFLLQPVPEPSTWLIALFAIPLIYFLRRTPSHPAKGFPNPSG